MPQWKNMLKEIKKIEEGYGSTLSNPATDVEFNRMNDYIRQKFGNIVLPKSYLEFLKEMNGLDFNRLVIYGIDKHLLDEHSDEDIYGFIETNEIWYENEWQKQYLFFGDSDVAWYCYDQKDCIYVELDKPSGTLMQTFEDFDTMLSYALETVLF